MVLHAHSPSSPVHHRLRAETSAGPFSAYLTDARGPFAVSVLCMLYTFVPRDFHPSLPVSPCLKCPAAANQAIPAEKE
jgi:hypothetical protein